MLCFIVTACSSFNKKPKFSVDLHAELLVAAFNYFRVVADCRLKQISIPLG